MAAGCIGHPPTNRDALLLQRHSSIQLDYHWHNPIALNAAIAPHIAADQENRTSELHLPQLIKTCENSLHQAENSHESDDCWQLVEGAGGWMVPIDQQHTLADLALQLNAAVILVVGMRLGCINHALLSVQAIQQSGLPIAGWVANCLAPNMDAETSNLEYLTQALNSAGIPLLGTVPYRRDLDIDESDIEHVLPKHSDIEDIAQYLTLPDQVADAHFSQ